MNINVSAERVCASCEKVSSFFNPATAFQVFISLSLVAFAVQGIPFLAVHTANIISGVQLGYWLTGGGAIVFFVTLLWVLLHKN